MSNERNLRLVAIKNERIAELERQLVRSGERRAEYEEAAWALKERVIDLEKLNLELQMKLCREWEKNLKNP
jgi:predicted  nucleic acid-binding Zn-ribbon protein